MSEEEYVASSYGLPLSFPILLPVVSLGPVTLAFWEVKFSR